MDKTLFLGQTKILAKGKSFKVDDTWDTFNHIYMFNLMVILGAIVTLQQYNGKTISCNGFTKYGSDFHEDYCWTQGLYTTAEAYHISETFLPYPGIVPEDIPCLGIDGKGCADGQDVTTRVYHLWYQWVPFYFWFSAIAYAMPYLVYKKFGFSDLKPVMAMFHNFLPDDADCKSKEVEKASVWLYNKLSVLRQKGAGPARLQMGIGMLFIKTVYLIMPIVQLVLTSQMFELADYTKFGTTWMAEYNLPLLELNQTGIKDVLFPKMVACEIKRWGPSGLEEENGMCVLAPNVINQYFFLITWWALMILLTTNSLNILLSIVKMLFTYGSYQRMISRACMKHKDQYKKVFDEVGVSGRLILTLLSNNLPAEYFRAMMDNVCPRLLKRRDAENETGL